MGKSGQLIMVNGITAIILTKNEENYVGQCIDGIRSIADRIFVVDSFSDDNTIEILKEKNVEFVQHKFENHSKQYKFAVEAAKIRTTWIMRIDADEWMTPESSAELKEMCDKYANNNDVTGIQLRFANVFMGKQIKHGGMYPWRKLSVYKTGIGDIEDREMDEHIILKHGRIVKTKKDSIHMCFRDLVFFTKKANWYSTKEMIDFYNNDKVDKENSSLKTRIKMKIYYKLPSGFRSWLYYKYRYLIRLGFLDGKIGKIYFFLNCYWYRYLVDAKILEHKKLNTELIKTGDLK